MFVVYETASGRAVSFGSVVADPLPEGLSVADVGDVSLSTHQWDETTRTMVERPPVLLDTMSRGDFMLRLGFERETMLHAVRLNPSTPIETRAQLEMLNGWLNRVTEVNVKHQATQLGVQLMAGILASLDALPEGAEAFAATMLAEVSQ